MPSTSDGNPLAAEKSFGIERRLMNVSELSGCGFAHGRGTRPRSQSDPSSHCFSRVASFKAIRMHQSR